MSSSAKPVRVRLSVVVPSGKPKAKPPFWHFSAAARKASQVQLASAGSFPAG